MRHPQLRKHRLIRQRKDRSIRPNRQRQRTHRNRRKPRALAQNPRPILHVPPQLIPPPQSQRTPHPILVRRDCAKLHPCLPHRRPHVHPPLHQARRASLEMKAHLLFHIRLQPLPTRHRSQPRPSLRPHPHPAPAHDCTSATSADVSRRIAPIIPAIWFHFSVCAANCFRPAAVSV